MYGHAEVAMALMERGADIDARNRDQSTPLHEACRKGIKEVALALVEKGVDIDGRDDYQRTPLHYACRNGHVEVAMALMERGVEIVTKGHRYILNVRRVVPKWLWLWWRPGPRDSLELPCLVVLPPPVFG